MKKLAILFFAIALLQSCAVVKKYTPEGVRKDKNVLNILWTKSTEGEYATGNLPIAVNSPLIKNGLLYLGDSKSSMNAYQLDNGKLVWSQLDNGGYHSSPTWYQDKIIYGTNEGRVYSRDALTGKLVYSVDLGASIESPGTIAKGRIFFHLRNHQIFCLDVETGKIIWAYKRNVSLLTTIQRVSSPVVHKNNVFVGFADGHMTNLSLQEGIVLWERKVSNGNKFIDVDMTPYIDGNKMFVGAHSGKLNVLDIKTGLTIRKIDIPTTRAPFEFQENLIFGGVDGVVSVVSRNGEILLQKKFSKHAISSVESFKGHLIVSDMSGNVLVVDPTNFDIVSKKNLGHGSSAVLGQLEVSDKFLAVFSSRNRLYVYR